MIPARVAAKRGLAVAGGLILAIAGAVGCATAKPAPAVAPVAPVAAIPEPRSLQEVAREHWDAWCGGKPRITAADLDDDAASPLVHGEEAAAVAAFVQQLNRLRTKELIDGIDRVQVLPPVETPAVAPADPAKPDAGAALRKQLEQSYRAALRKQREIPTQLWMNNDGPSFAAIRQSREGDCWLLATTGWMVKHRPDEVRKAIEPAGANRWRVRFANGETVEVSTPTETELLAVNSEATLKDGLWLPIVKEAMGAIIGETNAKKQEIDAESLRISGGSGSRMLQRWTGHKVKVYRLEGKTPIDEVRAALVDAVERNAAMGAGTPKTPKGKIPPNHALAIFGFDAARDVLITWNPWGNDFTPAGPDGRDNGYTRKQGIAEIPLADFVELFRGLWIETAEPATR